MAFVASSLATEQRISPCFLHRERPFSRLHEVILRSEWAYLRRSFVRRHGKSKAVVNVVCALAVRGTQMDGIWIAVQGRTGCRADALDVRRPRDGKRIGTPNLLEQFAVGSLREPVGQACRVGQTHFHGIRRWCLRLLGAGTLQAVATGAHVPEIPAHKITLERFVV